MIFSATGCCGSASTNPQMYTLGGCTSVSFPAGVTTADKSDMTAETTAAASSANLSGNRASVACAGNPGVAGYTTGGRANLSSTPDLATADKTVTASDTTSATSSANLSQAREEHCGLSERTTKCYFIGGGRDVAGTLTAVTTADVTTFSGDSTSSSGTAVLGTAVKAPGGTTGNSSKGYVAGGFTAAIGSSCVTTGNKLTYSGDSMSATASVNLTQARAFFSGGSDGSTKAYFAGGQNGSPLSKIDKVTISTDTTSAIVATMSRNQYAGASDGTKLVCLSGSTSDASGTKITFSTDTAAGFGSGSAGNLSTARNNCGGFSTSAL